ncbi:hypothetical protein [Corallococcus silvisoli]|uniref:hypothetical protein n=1 Tax=Corallococcus silvisoli TaxID=2697031 RepID=UPI0013776861|nr:hypothetical protein [Corallococcus silvisoli]NBD14351.1 hypothetical protein [Corallococcus silvisoli]
MNGETFQGRGLWTGSVQERSMEEEAPPGRPGELGPPGDTVDGCPYAGRAGARRRGAEPRGGLHLAGACLGGAPLDPGRDGRLGHGQRMR